MFSSWALLIVFSPPSKASPLKTRLYDPSPASSILYEYPWSSLKPVDPDIIFAAAIKSGFCEASKFLISL